MSETTSSPLPLGESGRLDKDAMHSNNEEVRWEIVFRTSGLLSAQITAGRLQAVGIPARAWQEAAGQAFGLTVGLLGTGNVSVPEEYVDQALELLESDASEFDMDDFEEE
ncbi:MAG: DUF2007 domain-containing protein [Ardenticatenaceae bacterium]|nr:DUF2007 domain-containing protein [Anaerolineales bacterium]MCB8923207.1 DUF2007 domain-containing protein [Ardenticatenaceae bacterium]MCB9004848.1 DUF2007 domain-containing protein [Ardenticatenaceae bacterium]